MLDALQIPKALVIIYVEGGGRRGVKAILDWLEGGLIFFLTINRGSSFLRFCKGSCLCFSKWDYFYKIN